MKTLDEILNVPRPRKDGFESMANESYYGAKNKITSDDIYESESTAAGIDMTNV